jgi:hypothetical protein
VSSTCFEPLSVHPQAEWYMQFYGIFFMHPYKKFGWWEDVLDTIKLLIPILESQYCMHCAWRQMHPVSHSWVDRLNCTGTCLVTLFLESCSTGCRWMTFLSMEHRWTDSKGEKWINWRNTCSSATTYCTWSGPSWTQFCIMGCWGLTI